MDTLPPKRSLLASHSTERKGRINENGFTSCVAARTEFAGFSDSASDERPVWRAAPHLAAGW